ncbi:unnamed protein product [Auanema sp. JU1783]|nr:unnamed protein product [Auanema sp. JU1783]
MFPSLISTLFLGVVSDYWSIKIPLIIPFVGLILGTVNYIFQTIYIHSNIHWLLISDAIFGICGGYISIISTTMSYGVKTTGKNARSYRIAGMEGAIGLGGTIGYALSGTIRQAFGYDYTFLVILILQLIGLIYIIVLARDHIDSSEHRRLTSSSTATNPSRCSLFFSQVYTVIQSFYEVLAVPRETRKFIWLNLLALGLELLIFSGLSDIQFSYFRFKLAWTDKEYGWFSGLSFGLTTFTVLTIYPLCRSRGVSDGQLGVFGIFFKILSLIVLAFLQNAFMAYSVSAITMFNRFVSSSLRSFLSSLIMNNEQGKMFSLIALLEGITSLAATSIYNNVYPLTLSFFPGLCYLASAVLLLPSLTILGYSDHKIRKMQEMENFET